MLHPLTWIADPEAAPPAIAHLGCAAHLRGEPLPVRAPFSAHLGVMAGETDRSWTQEAHGLAWHWQWQSLGQGLALRLSLTNTGPAPVRLERVAVASLEAASGGHLHTETPWACCAFYQHGWTSWAPTIVRSVIGADRLVEPEPTDAIYTAHHAPFAEARGGLVSSELTLIGTAENAWLWGFLELEHAPPTVLTLALAHDRFDRLNAELLLEGLPLAPGERWDSPRLWIARGTPEDLLEAYAGWTAPPALPDGPAHGGWCTWYYYFGANDATDVRANLAAMGVHPAVGAALDWVLIDDGHQRAIGDWLETDTERYPGGLAPLAAEIRALGKAPGLWIAPFCVSASSRLFRDHPNWVVRDPASGAPAVIQHHWDAEIYALDLTHPEVLEHLAELVRVLTREWGFAVLKLDFLHFAAHPGERHDPHQNRLAAFRRGLAVIREAAGIDVHVLGCGAPLAASLGLVDSMRVSQDVGVRWESATPADMSSVSTAHACMNTVLRLWQHGRWWINDPDCVLIRDNDDFERGTPAPQLSEAERRFLLTVVALTGGSTISGDALNSLAESRWRQLASVLPPTGQAARWVRGFTPSLPRVLHLPLETPWDAWHLVALLNWDDAEATVALPIESLGLAGGWEAFDVWETRPLPAVLGPVSLPVAPHGARLIALKRQRELPWVFWDDRHFSQGRLGLTGCERLGAADLAIGLSPVANADGTLWVGGAPGWALCGVEGLAPGEACEEAGEGFWRLQLHVSVPRRLIARFTPAR